VYAGSYTVKFVPHSPYQSHVDTGVSVNAGVTSAGVNAALTLPPPVNTAVPTITGNAHVGQTLTEVHGSWTNSPTRYSYQWEDCSRTCSVIAGATSQRYTLTAADAGYAIRAEEFATNAGGTSSPATSAPSAVVGGSSQTHKTRAKVSSARIRALLRRALAAHGRRARIQALLRNDGYSFSFAAPAAGRLRITWHQAPRHGKKHGKKLLVASVSVVFHKSARATVKLVLTRKGRTLLNGLGAVKISAQGSFAPLGGVATRATKSLRLKP
jgi:hypothetical protein